MSNHAVERPDVYSSGGVWYFRASALGGCSRSLTAAALGIPSGPVPKWLREAFDRGKAAEPVVAAWMESKGWEVHQEQVNVSLVLDTYTVVTGNVDWLATPLGMNRVHVVETKNLSGDNTDRFLEGGFAGLGMLGRKYAWQLSDYMHAENAPGVLLVRNSATGDVYDLYFETPPISKEEMAKKCRQILTAVQNEEYPPCDGKCSKGDLYWHVHDEEGVELSDDPELFLKVERRQGIKDEIAKLQEELDDINNELLDMTKEGVTHVHRWKIRHVPAGLQKRIDSKAVRKDHGDRYDTMVPTAPHVKVEGGPSATTEGEDAGHRANKVH